MIGFILGTSEGKKILSSVNQFTDDIAVSTATVYGGQLLKDYKIKSLNTRPLNKKELLEWIKDNNIEILVDASHPYAKDVTINAIECANELKIQYIRYDRPGVLEKYDSKNIIRVNNYEEVISAIKNIEGNILNTTGGNNVLKFINIDFKHRIIHRILPSVAVLSKLVESGIKIKDIIAMQGPISYELESAFINQYDVNAIITKDSGIEGGALEKFRACQNCNIKIIVIEKPKFKYDLVFNDVDSLVKKIKEMKLQKS